ncbi:MAG: putative DNA binding domain-containing protein [Paludibacteraceae bacterium]|nr:putative DNA binding domain-containing protein [Paludibacteraceae bacterium]
MTKDQFVKLCQEGESTTVEYKSCESSVSHSVYESICSMLNHNGGWILLGVKDDGTPTGVDQEKLDAIVKSILDATNNPELFYPTPYIYPEIISLEEKNCIALQIPCGLYVYRYNNRFWDRLETSDYDVTESLESLMTLFERKNPHIFEDRIVPEMTIDDIDKDTLSYCRKLLAAEHPTHPWITMEDEEILETAKLLTPNKGRKTFKFASLLLFGTDDAIEKFLPRYRFEAIFRMCTFNEFKKMKDTSNRYDDRLTLRCNLIRTYGKLTEFVVRHMPDKFHLTEDGVQRIDLRIAIMREVLGNLCVHADYSSGYACFLEIFKDCVMTKNPTRLMPQTHEGEISITELGNYTKNPLLVKVFHELNWVEDLGSGTRNILKYAPLYYKDFKIGISNGQQFIFALTYAETQEIGENVGRNHEMSVENVGRNHEMSVENVGKNHKATDRKNKRKQAIISLIIENPKITQAQMSEKLGVTEKTIERDTEELKNDGIIQYSGEKKNGVWLFLKK